MDRTILILLIQNLRKKKKKKKEELGKDTDRKEVKKPRAMS